MKKFIVLLLMVICITPTVVYGANGEYELKEEKKIQFDNIGSIDFDHTYMDGKAFITFEEKNEALYILKYTKDAEIVWQKKYTEHYIKRENYRSASIKDIIEQEDGYILIRDYHVEQTQSIIITKFDKNGEKVYETQIDNSQTKEVIKENNCYLLILNDGGSNNYNDFIAEINAKGEIIKQSSPLNYEINDIVKANGVYVALGVYEDDYRSEHSCVIQFDNNFNKIMEFSNNLDKMKENNKDIPEELLSESFSSIDLIESNVILSSRFGKLVYSTQDYSLTVSDKIIKPVGDSIYDNPRGGYVKADGEIYFYDENNHEKQTPDSIIEGRDAYVENFFPAEDGYIAVGTFWKRELEAGAIVKFDYDGNILWTKEIYMNTGDVMLDKAFYLDDEIIVLGSKQELTRDNLPRYNYIFTYSNKEKEPGKNETNKKDSVVKKSSSNIVIIVVAVVAVLGALTGVIFYIMKVKKK